MTVNAMIQTDALLESDLLENYCKAAGDSLRLSILQVLQDNAYSVLEICQLFGVRQPAMSHHLKVLASAGLVTTRREGNTIFYRRVPALDNPLLGNLHVALLSTVDRLPFDKQLQLKIQKLHRDRSEASRQFFQDNALRFQQNQDLIANYSDYGTSIVELLDVCEIDRNHVLEVGPGQGELLAELAPRFNQVFALDNVEAMLNLSRQFSEQAGLKNIEFILGNLNDDSLKLPVVDCITLNMVLHHIPQPSQAFSTLANILKPGGILLLTDLCQHEQQWVKQSCGDLWQGFAPEELNQWAVNARLVEGQSVFLALRNGFRIQIRLYEKPEI